MQDGDEQFPTGNPKKSKREVTEELNESWVAKRVDEWNDKSTNTGCWQNRKNQKIDAEETWVGEVWSERKRRGLNMAKWALRGLNQQHVLVLVLLPGDVNP